MCRSPRSSRVLGLALCLAAGLAFVPHTAEAAVVKILTSVKASSISGADADDDLDAFYRDLGATSSLHTGAIAAADLTDVDLLVIMLPDDAFSPAEIAAIDDFLVGGGELLAIGEQEVFAAPENGYLEDLLAGLGSALSLGSVSLDPGFNDTVSAQIIDQPGLTDNVSLVNYGNVNTVVGFDPGRRLFLASHLISVWGAYELIKMADHAMYLNKKRRRLG